MPGPENRRKADTSLPSALNRARILVVEDQDDVRGLLVTALQIEGHAVDDAPNAHDGLRRLQAARYDLVLSDYAMPGGTGTWMLHEAARQGVLGKTPTLIITAHPDARELETLEVIPKPIDLDHFLDQVRRVLDTASDRSGGDATDLLAAPKRSHRIDLILYVSPNSPASLQARRNLEDVLSRYDSSQVKYSVCDLVRDPLAGEVDRVAFTPTLVKRYPAPRTWILGNLRETEVVADLLRVCGVDPTR